MGSLFPFQCSAPTPCQGTSLDKLSETQRGEGKGLLACEKCGLPGPWGLLSPPGRAGGDGLALPPCGGCHPQPRAGPLPARWPPPGSSRGEMNVSHQGPGVCGWASPGRSGLLPGGGTKRTWLGAVGGTGPPSWAGPGGKEPRAPSAGLGALGGRRWQLWAHISQPTSGPKAQRRVHRWVPVCANVCRCL